MAEKHIVLAFGRTAGITKGHQKVFENVAKLAKKYSGTAHVHLSQSFDKKKNPLPYKDKIDLARKMMPHLKNIFEDDSTIKTPFHMLAKYSDPDTIVHMIAGGDRVKEYQDKFDKYNGKDYHYKKIIVHNAGERTDGISGTALRNLATAGNFDKFKEYAPTTAKEVDVKRMYDLIRKTLLNEDWQKNIGTLLAEAVTATPEKGKRKLLKVKNKFMINPDFDKYQMKTHKAGDCVGACTCGNCGDVNNSTDGSTSLATAPTSTTAS